MSGYPNSVLIATDAVGGVWVYSLELAGMLAKRGAEVTLAVLGPAATPDHRRAAAAAGANLYDTGLALDWTVESPAALAAISAALAELSRKLAAELVQLHTPALVGDAAWPAPVLAVVHSCVGTWWVAVRGEAPPPEDFRWRMAAMKQGLERADLVIAPSRALAEAVARVYGSRRRIDVVHNGRLASSDIRNSSEGWGVLAAGRLWDEGKNIAVLDEAAAAMEIPVRAAGAVRGPNGAAIALRAVEELGLLDEAGVAEAMAAARVFAAPALYEPFGLAVMEAAQAGLPLVLADILTFRELWDGAAIFLPPREPTAWAKALMALHADPAVCDRWGQKAKARAAAYSPARFEAEMWERYAVLGPAACLSAA